MYRIKPLFPYADGMYMVMPAGLPDRFYPKEPERKYVIDCNVICFLKDVPQDIKERLIKDYTEYWQKEKESGVFR